MWFPDWTHSNAIIYSPDDGNLLLSMRHQSWVIKIDYQDGRGAGDVLWRLGYQGDFTISSGLPSDWMYAQHFPFIVGPNSAGVFKLAVMDNGDNRVLDSNGTVCGTPGTPGPQVANTIPCYTRAVIFQVDEGTKTASVYWQDNFDPIYSYWGGSVQQLAGGNVFICLTVPSDNMTGSRYLEVTSDPTPQVAMQIEISGQNAYRIIHMPSLYPGVQW